jgi:serine/threonine protein kinase
MLCGKHVFEGNTIPQICAAHIHTQPPPMESRFEGSVPEKLEKIVLDCLAKKPEDRPQTAQYLRKILDECDVPKWSEDEAKEWWDRRGEDIAEVRRQAEQRMRQSEGSATLAVDIKDRIPCAFASTVQVGNSGKSWLNMVLGSNRH